MTLSLAAIKIIVTFFLLGLTGYVVYALVKEVQSLEGEHTTPPSGSTQRPTEAPTTKPTSAPTTKPTSAPTSAPTTKPTSAPTPAPVPPPVLVTQATPGRIWSEGQRAKIWSGGMGNPTLISAPHNLYLWGSAVYAANENNAYVQVIGGVNQNGRIYFGVTGAKGPLTCWELRAVLKVNNSAVGDELFLFGNETATSISNQNIGISSNDGIAAGIDLYNFGDAHDKLIVGRLGNKIKTAESGINIYGDTYKTYVLRRFGDKGEFFIESEGSNTAYTGFLFDMANNEPSGEYFGVGAWTGGGGMYAECQYIELRYIDQ